MVRQVYVPKPVRIIITKPVSPVIPAQTELSLVEECFHLACHLEPEVAPVDVYAFARCGTFDNAPTVSVGGVNPIVQAKFKPVHPVLLVTFPETRKKHFPQIGFAVAVGILGIKDFRCCANEYTLAPCHDSSREIEFGEKHGRTVIFAIQVSILQEPYHAS